MYAPLSSAFASVRRRFDDPRASDAVVVTVPPGTEGAAAVRLTATEAYEALYGPDADPQFAAAVWREAIRTASIDITPDGTWKLVVIWLALPRLTGTVHRVCTRLGADRSGAEAETVLAILEELAAPDAASRLSETSLIHAARTRAWRFARNGLRELPCALVDRVIDNLAPAASDEETDPPADEFLDVWVDRPDSPEGLCIPPRFRVREEQLRKGPGTDAGDGTRNGSGRRRPRKKQHSGYRAGTRPAHPGGRRA